MSLYSFWNLNTLFISSFIIGITNASIRITRMSYFFEKIPNNLIGRVNTIFNSVKHCNKRFFNPYLINKLVF